MRSSLIAVILSLLLTIVTFAQDATPIPQDLLELSYQQCYQPCRQGFDHKVCDTLCRCSVDQFKADMDFGQYLLLLESMSRNEVSDADRDYLDGVAKQCSDALEKSGIKVIPNTPEDDGLPQPPNTNGDTGSQN